MAMQHQIAKARNWSGIVMTGLPPDEFQRERGLQEEINPCGLQ